jgi:CheY-like chemotaxis protein
MAAAAAGDSDPVEASKRPTILVVEDEVLIRLMISDHLRSDGFAVIEAASADEALKILQSSAPVHLLFTDVRMPGPVDGLALMEHARTMKPDLKIIVTSGHAAAGRLRDIADDFFSKPYDLARVSARIAVLLNIENT